MLAGARVACVVIEVLALLISQPAPSAFMLSQRDQFLLIHGGFLWGGAETLRTNQSAV